MLPLVRAAKILLVHRLYRAKRNNQTIRVPNSGTGGAKGSVQTQRSVHHPRYKIKLPKCTNGGNHQNTLGMVTPDGLYQWEHMPFGLPGAPFYFQYVIDATLAKDPSTNAVSFVDDITIHNKIV